MRCFGVLLSLSFILLISIAVSQPPKDRSEEDNDPYQVIIKNNLFRPLGWNPKPQRPPYQLLGTVIGPGDQAKALIRMGGRTVYVKVGERIGGAVLKEVREREAVLEENGKPIELKIEQMGFLGTTGSRGRGGGPPKGEKPEVVRASQEIERGERPPKMERPRPPRIPQRILDRIPPEMMEEFKNASPDERRAMLREFFRRRFGGRRRGR